MLNQQDYRWKAEIVNKLESNPWFSVLLQTVTRPDGTRVPYYTIDFPFPSVGVIVRRGTQYLLTRQHRFIVDQLVWAIPSGGVESGESLTEAAAREVLEETGYRITNPRHLFFYYPSYGNGNQRFEFFLADDPVQVSDFDRNEVMEVRWFEQHEVIGMIMENKIVDGLSLTSLAFLFLKDSLSRRND